VIAASAFIGEALVIAANKPANAQATAATSAALDTDAARESYSAKTPRRDGPNNENLSLMRLARVALGSVTQCKIHPPT
jgi:hypothetical protein